MNWVLSRRKGSERSEDWLKYFDAVVVGCQKPGYFIKRNNLFEVHTKVGGARMSQLATVKCRYLRGGSFESSLIGDRKVCRMQGLDCHMPNLELYLLAAAGYT
jgi:hypothetical protein